jgi:hypothetical protein
MDEYALPFPIDEGRANEWDQADVGQIGIIQIDRQFHQSPQRFKGKRGQDQTKPGE